MAFALHFFACVLVLATLLPLSRAKIWWVRGLDFPRSQIAVLAAALVVAHFLMFDVRNVSGLVSGGLCVAVCFYQAAWIWTFTPLHRREVAKAKANAPGQHVRMLTANVLMTNRNAGALLALVQEFRPDLVLTLETNRWWQEQLVTLEKELPHTIAVPLENLYGMHLYSRWPLVDPKIQFLVEPDKPSIHSCVLLPTGCCVRLVCLHPAPPSPTENEESTQRDAELILVARSLADERRPCLVAGDLNDVAWSRTTRLFRKISGMLDPRVGRGLYNTFHARYPFLRWPVDHFFHSRHFTLAQLRRLGFFGSDHFPVVIDLVLADGSSNEEAPSASSEDVKEARVETAIAAAEPSDVHVPRSLEMPRTTTLDEAACSKSNIAHR